MAPIAGCEPIRKGTGPSVRDLGISEPQARFILERGGIMTIYRAASVVG